MTASPLPPRSDPLALAGARADNTAASLRLVADHYERLVFELARTIGVEELEEETAHVIVTLARQVARYRHGADEPPPGEDKQDIYSRVVRGAMLLLQAEDDERADQALAAMIG